MTVHRRFIVLLLVIYGSTATIAYIYFRQEPIAFFIIELVCLLTIPVSIKLYLSLTKPLSYLVAGLETIKDKDFSATLVKTGFPELDKLIEMYNSMIEQLRTERSLQQEQHFFLEKLIDASPAGIVILDVNNRIVSCNSAALRFLSLPFQQLKAKSFADLSGPLPEALACLGTDESTLVSDIRGSSFTCRKSSFIDAGFQRTFFIIEEVTREMAVAERRVYEKLIRMMAHEVNNSVGAINSILQTGKEYGQLLPEHLQGAFSNALTVALDRNSELCLFIDKLAAIVRLSPPDKRDVAINSLIEPLAVLFEIECRERQILLSIHPGETNQSVLLDREQMQQVLINIVKNSCESIGTGGEIYINAFTSPLRLTIRDNGKGIDEKARYQLFNPFFSTKKRGQGIGLMLIKEILTNHSFPFSLQTLDNGWTVFEIQFQERQDT